ARLLGDVGAGAPGEITRTADAGVLAVGANERTAGDVFTITIGPFLADVAAQMHADVGAGDVVVPSAVQAANLHVLDRFGLDGKIGCLSSPHRNESCRGAEEKTFHHLHCCSSVLYFGGRVRSPRVRLHPWNVPVSPRTTRNPYVLRIPSGTTW